ncbi:MAG TPA: uracil-DNA glycosylase [Gemmatimonadaceae bacterium]
MDARDRLRRFLEQRREAGETELVFDQLSVDEAMRLLGAAPVEETGNRKQEAGKERSAVSEAQTPPPASGASEDWRAVLKDAGGAPTEKDSRYSMPAPSATPTTGDTHATMPLELVPQGIIIGGAGRELFGGTTSPYATLEELSTAVSTCTLCPLYREAKNPVPGEGNPNADFMCVGEAPGATEDELGRPFVGQAGQLLDKILGAIKLSRNDVYICNVLKHRPPGNRNPMPDEVQACSPYLLRQIELIRPRVIVAFGTFAAQTLLNTREGIGKLRGKIHRYYGVPLVVTYHPAALLRNPAWKRPTWDDVQLARRLLDRTNSS